MENCEFFQSQKMVALKVSLPEAMIDNRKHSRDVTYANKQLYRLFEEAKNWQ